MTALVLSAGGMYGAYQAGAWRVLAERFQPDLIVGASIGAVNGARASDSLFRKGCTKGENVGN